MKRKKNILVFLSIILLGNLYAQKVSNIDFDKIKLTVQDSSSNYHYPYLIERFLDFETDLMENEYHYIYYGSIYQDNYSPYRRSDNEKMFFEKVDKRMFEEAIAYGKRVIKENPVNLQVLFRMLVCYYELDDKETASQYAKMYYGLLNVIHRSGDGKSKETAYVVICVSDEYEILANLDLTPTSQALSGRTDIITVKGKRDAEQTPIEGKGKKSKKMKIINESIYFDVSKPFESLRNKNE
jgi:hypothetical protein